MAIATVKAVAHGKVQGVFFRATAQKLAKTLELTGTVKNLPNGTVELFVQGNIDVIHKFFYLLRKEYNLREEAISWEKISFEKVFATFEIT